MQTKKIRIDCPFVQTWGTLAVVAGLLPGAIGKVYHNTALLAVGVGLVILGLLSMTFINGSCFADDKGVVFNMPLRDRQFIPYGDIDWAYLDVESGGKTKGSSSVSLVHKLNIVTKYGGTVTFKTRHGHADTVMRLYDPKQKEYLLIGSPFAPIEKQIKLMIGETTDQSMRTVNMILSEQGSDRK